MMERAQCLTLTIGLLAGLHGFAEAPAEARPRAHAVTSWPVPCAS